MSAVSPQNEPEELRKTDSSGKMTARTGASVAAPDQNPQPIDDREGEMTARSGGGDQLTERDDKNE